MLEESVYMDKNNVKETKQIVIKGIARNNKEKINWRLSKNRKLALISVYDKNNLRFLCSLLKKNKIGIISTGSLQKKLNL